MLLKAKWGGESGATLAAVQRVSATTCATRTPQTFTEGGEPPSGVSEAYGEGAGGGTRIRGNVEWRHTVKVCASASVGQRGKALAL